MKPAGRHCFIAGQLPKGARAGSTTRIGRGRTRSTAWAMSAPDLLPDLLGNDRW